MSKMLSVLPHHWDILTHLKFDIRHLFPVRIPTPGNKRMRVRSPVRKDACLFEVSVVDKKKSTHLKCGIHNSPISSILRMPNGPSSLIVLL